MPRDFETGDLRSFVATVRAGSITRGAVVLGLTQPAVSQRIQRLERAAGEQILVRETRGARLTPAGETLLAYAERVLALHDEARSALGGRDDNAAGRRAVGLLDDLAITALPAVLADFAALHPRIDLEVVIAPAANLRSLADQGELDLTLGDPTIMSEASVRWRQQVSLEWVGAPAFDPSTDPLPLVLFTPPCSWRQPALDGLSRHGRRWRVAFQSTSVHAVQTAICAGIGIGALLANNVPPTARRLTARHDLPPAPKVDLAISRRADTDTDKVLDSLERLLHRATASY